MITYGKYYPGAVEKAEAPATKAKARTRRVAMFVTRFKECGVDTESADLRFLFRAKSKSGAKPSEYFIPLCFCVIEARIEQLAGEEVSL